MHFRPLGIDEVSLVHDLLLRAYLPAYAHFWEDGGQWYVERMYNTDRLREEFREAGARFFAVEAENRAAGILKLLLADTSETRGGVHLQRLYLLPAVQGRGIGQHALQFTYEMARNAERMTIYLTAMDQSPARHFYEKAGFITFRQQRLPYPGMRDEMRMLNWMKRPVPVLQA